MQETPQQYPEPHKQPHPSRIPPHSNTTTFNWNSSSLYNKYNKQVQPIMDHCSRTYLTSTHLEPAPPSTHQSNGASPAPSANMTETLMQIIAQVTNNKKDNVSKQMMKNIKIFNSTNKAEYITWLSQLEAAARFSNASFRELICQSMAPSMLHVLSELSALTTNEDIKNAILTNYSDIPKHNRSCDATAKYANITH